MNKVYLCTEDIICNEILNIDLKLDMKYPYFHSYMYTALNIHTGEFKHQILKAIRKAYNKKYNIHWWHSKFKSDDTFFFELLKDNPLIIVVYNNYIIYGDLFNIITRYDESFLSINDKLQTIITEIQRIENVVNEIQFRPLAFIYYPIWVEKQNIAFKKAANIYKYTQALCYNATLMK